MRLSTPYLVTLGSLLASTPDVLAAVDVHDAQGVFESSPHVEFPPASLPVENSTHSYWLYSEPDVNPLARVGSDGDLTADADVCIVGSGMTGVSTAYHLSQLQPGLKTVILEARDFCSGATGRNGGHLTPLIARSFRHLQELHGTEEAVRGFTLETRTTETLVKFIQDHDIEQNVTLINGGHSTVFLTTEEENSARDDHRAAEAAGLEMNVTWYTREEMTSRYGTPYTGFSATGYNFYPLKLVTQLFKLASGAADVTLHTRTPVTSVKSTSQEAELQGKRRWILETPRGQIACSYVVHATNAYASHLLPHLAGPTGIIPTRGQTLALRANTNTSDLTASSWDANEMNEYWVPRPATADDEHPIIIVGGGREAAVPTHEFYETDDSKLNDNTTSVLKGFLPKMFPEKFEEGREPELSWSGIMGYTNTSDPFVGPVVLKANDLSTALDGQYISAGYNGHGMPRVFSCAEAVASMISAKIQQTNWTAPEWLPERYLTWKRPQ